MNPVASSPSSFALLTPFIRCHAEYNKMWSNWWRYVQRASYEEWSKRFVCVVLSANLSSSLCCRDRYWSNFMLLTVVIAVKWFQLTTSWPKTCVIWLTLLQSIVPIHSTLKRVESTLSKGIRPWNSLWFKRLKEEEESCSWYGRIIEIEIIICIHL